MNNLYILIDTSGSMVEMAKKSILHNLLSFVNQYFDYHTNNYNSIEVIQWNKEVTVCSLSNEEVKPLLTKGKLNLEAMKSYLSLKNDKKLKILLLSDGNFDKDVADYFFKLKSNNNLISTVSIGADSQIEKLKNISNYHYSSEDMITAIKSLEFTNSTKPNNINEVINNTSKVQDEKDEW